MLEENRLYGLAYNCPLLETQEDCPLKKWLHLSFKEKVKWIDNLSEEEKKTILEHHKSCSGNKIVDRKFRLPLCPNFRAGGLVQETNFKPENIKLL